MIAALADQFLAAAAAADGDGEGNGLVFLLLLAGPAYFALIYVRYRNTDKRHHHEKETRAEMADVRVRDDFVRALKGVENSRMRGANNTAVRGSLRKLF